MAQESNIKKIEGKMNDLMYRLLKDACSDSFVAYLETCDISEDEYEEIREIWIRRLGITPYT